MPDRPSLVIDSSVFMQAARVYYAFDLAPGFWEALVQRAAEGRVLSIDHVMVEIKRGKDALSDWSESAFRHAFVATTEPDVTAEYTSIMRWVAGNQQFLDSAKAEFADGADGWVVAYAKARGLVVVTQEVLSPGVKRKVPIPNVCEQFGVKWMDTFAMLRALGITLKL